MDTMQERGKTNSSVAIAADQSEVAGRAKVIRRVGLVELILGMLCMLAALLDGQITLHHAIPAGAPFWASLTSPAVLRSMHIVWDVYLMSLILFWHCFLCRRLQRPSRPIGFAIGTLVFLKFISAATSFVYMRLAMNSINVTYNGTVINLGSQFGIYIDLFIVADVTIAFLAGGFAAFWASQKTKKALENTDQARYTLDAIPLSVFLVVVLFIYLTYGYLTNIIHPSLTLAGIHPSTLIQEATLLTFAATCAFTAWALYTLRPWAWFMGLLAGMAWALSSYSSPADMSAFSGPKFERYKDLFVQITPAFQQYMQFNDILILIELIVFIVYLIYLRRYLVNGAPTFHSSKSSGSRVPIYANRQSLRPLSGSWLIFGGLGLMQWFQHDYFIALTFVFLTIIMIALILISTLTPRYVFREEGLAFTGFSLLFTPVFPYTSFNSVQLITTPKPPKRMRSIEDGVMNLNVSVLRDIQRAQLEEEFRKRNIEVTTLAPATAS